MDEKLPGYDMPNPDPLERYFELRERITKRTQDLSQRYSSHLRCRRGCSFCCEEITVLPLEIEAVRLWLARNDTSPPGSCDRSDAGTVRSIDRSAAGLFPATGTATRCALLGGDGACTVYAGRPVICRTHGLPLAYRVYEYDAKGREVNPDRPEFMDLWCDLNFSELDEADCVACFDAHGRINMDTINRELESLNDEFLRSPAGRRYVGGGERLPLRVLRAATRRNPEESASR